MQECSGWIVIGLQKYCVKMLSETVSAICYYKTVSGSLQYMLHNNLLWKSPSFKTRQQSGLLESSKDSLPLQMARINWHVDRICCRCNKYFSQKDEDGRIVSHSQFRESDKNALEKDEKASWFLEECSNGSSLLPWPDFSKASKRSLRVEPCSILAFVCRRYHVH